MTKPINGLSCFCTPFHTVYTKGEGQAVAPLSPLLWETPTPAHAAEQGPVPHNGAYTTTHTDAPRRVFVSASSHTPHQQLRRYISERCEDRGSVPQPSKVSYLCLMWGHI